jgi:phosphoglycolate phosphatase
VKKLTLILFDIDGTILDIRGAGRQAFVRTLDKVFGLQDDIRYIRFAGATDLDLLRQILERHGRSLTPADAESFFRQLPIELEERIAHAEQVIHPGVRELLVELTRDERTLVGLVTGNVESCARIKLRCFDLHDHFVLGAFGHEHGDRVEIARLALRRAVEHLGGADAIERVFLIGDTPSDIAAARAIGATSIAVATGGFDRAALADARADHILDNLSDTLRVLKILGL